MRDKVYTALVFLVLLCVTIFSGLASDLSGRDLLELMGDFPKHDSFQYITYNPLPESWFDEARVSLEEPFVYIVLSNTKSPASKIISSITGQQYNHASLSFDGGLDTLVSYNGGNGNSPGMNPETPALLQKLPGSSFAVYRLPVSPAQKQLMIEKIGQINIQGSSYNLVGLFTKNSAKPNIMFCSQFVYTLLEEAGIKLFEKKSGQVKPMDFVEQDKDQLLTPIYESEWLLAENKVLGDTRIELVTLSVSY